MPRSHLVKRVGLRIRDLRLKAGWSQEELGYRAKLHRNAVSLIERADRSPSLETLEKLAKALQVEPRELIPLLRR